MPKRTYTLLSVKFQQQLCLTIEPVVCVQYCLTIYFTYTIQQMVDWQGLAYKIELNTPAALELVLMCHLGPRTRKIEIYHSKLVKLYYLGPYHLTWRNMT